MMIEKAKEKERELITLCYKCSIEGLKTMSPERKNMKKEDSAMNKEISDKVC